MSEPKMISPMLDNFIMGSAMSEHHGVSCYPAIENETGDRYIVKVISIPASSTQLDALLLTGAYANKESALSYFKEVADSILGEIDTLEKLTELEGFISYNSSQIVPKESGDGYDIYLLAPYKRTLQKHFKRHSFTHLDALNLGLDLCAALSVSRRLGYLYVDLKPSNVFVNDQRLFRIGDLGFVRLDSLKYASLPEKFISTYTPPEIRDAFSALNTTMDVYAAGLILYQAYNNGELPFNTEVQPGDALPAPLYADYEMSEIILKACAANPDDRWQDPTQMGQAIISYMQRNGASDTPIVPVSTPEPAEEVPEEQESTLESVAEEENADNNAPEPEVIQDEPAADTILEDIQITPSADAEFNHGIIITDDTPETDVEPVTEESVDTPQDETTEDAAEASEENISNEEPVEEEQPEPEVTEDIIDEEMLSDDDDKEDFDPENEVAVTEEVSEMLTQADELASVDVPEPVVVPDHVDVPVPEVVPEEGREEEKEEEKEEAAPEEINKPEIIQETEVDEPVITQVEDDIVDEEEIDNTPPVKRNWLRGILIAVVLLALLAGGFFFYKNYYLLPVEQITVDGNMDTLTVYVDSQINENLLSVICSDTYGNKISAPVIDGKAEFTGLVPDTAYTVKVTVKGFHRLTGNAKTTYSTPIQTNVVQFDAVSGTTEDSVILSFTVEGPNVDNWTVHYSAEGEEDKTAAFNTQMITLASLTVGKEYTFRLVPDGDLYVTGQSEIHFTPSGLVFAENLRVTSCVNNTLSVVWDLPENITVANWSVHCYNDTYNQTITTTEPTAVFTDLDHTAGYNIEVKAAGMSVGQAITVAANSITAENFTIDVSDPTRLSLSWATSQGIPEGGWFLRYSIVGIANTETIPCSTNAVSISPIIPNATYMIRLEDVNGNVLLGSENVINTGDPVAFTKEFAKFTAQASDLQFTMVKTPNIPGWGRLDLNAGDYRSTFTVGEDASFLVRFDKLYNAPNEEVTILIVTRNQQGEAIHSGIQVNTWKKMWPLTYFKLNAPTLPSTPGEYTMDIYFDGMLVHEQSFTIK